MIYLIEEHFDNGEEDYDWRHISNAIGYAETENKAKDFIKNHTPEKYHTRIYGVSKDLEWIEGDPDGILDSWHDEMRAKTERVFHVQYNDTFEDYGDNRYDNYHILWYTITPLKEVEV